MNKFIKHLTGLVLKKIQLNQQNPNKRSIKHVHIKGEVDHLCEMYSKLKEFGIKPNPTATPIF